MKTVALIAPLALASLLNACGGLPAKRLFGFGGISSGGDRPEDEKKRQADASAGPTAPPPEAMSPEALSCEGNAADVGAGARFVVDSGVNASATTCDVTNPQGRFDCIDAITFGEGGEARIDYAEGVMNAGVAFGAHQFGQCNDVIRLVIDSALGSPEVHAFQLAPDGLSLVHVASGRVFARERSAE